MPTYIHTTITYGLKIRIEKVEVNKKKIIGVGSVRHLSISDERIRLIGSEVIDTESVLRP